MKGLPNWVLFLSLIVLFLLHNDLWLWDDATFILGLPAGLLYHIGYCFIAALLFLLIVNYAWPSHLETESEERTES